MKRAFKSILSCLFFLVVINGHLYAQAKFLTVFETQNTLDKTFFDSVQLILDNNILFAGKLKSIPTTTWKLFQNVNDPFKHIKYLKNQNPTAEYIFKFSLLDSLKHYNFEGLRFFRVKVIDLRTLTSLNIFDAYVNRKNEVSMVMPLVINHLKNILEGKPRKDRLYVIDKARESPGLAGCNNYRASVTSFFLRPGFYELFYVLQASNESYDNLIIGEPMGQDRVRFFYKQKGEIQVPQEIGCRSEASVYKTHLDQYCKKIYEHCKKN
jgi:hypothetical protein